MSGWRWTMFSALEVAGWCFHKDQAEPIFRLICFPSKGCSTSKQQRDCGGQFAVA